MRGVQPTGYVVVPGMIEPRASVLQLATGLVEAELDRDASAWHVTVRLHATLAKMVGTNGFDVLLGRALSLARRSHPVLAPFVVGPGGRIAGPADAAPDPVAVERAAVAVVANFAELLVVLIGEDLTMRLLREVHADASASGSSSMKEPTE